MFNVSLIYILEQKYPVCRVWAAFTMDVKEEIFETLIKIANIEHIYNIHKTKCSYSIMGKKELTFKDK